MSVQINNAKSPAESIAEKLKGSYELHYHGLKNVKRAYWNLGADQLNQEVEFRGETVLSGKDVRDYSPLSSIDRFIVREETTGRKINWGIHNRPFAPGGFSMLLQRVAAYLQQRDVFIQEGYTKGDPDNRRPVRIITEHAGQSLFARELLIQPEDTTAYKNFLPEFTIISTPGFQASPEVDGSASDKIAIINFEQRLALVGNCDNPVEIRVLMESVIKGEFGQIDLPVE